jgi:N-acetylglucosaminyl-diphospho-decaprenol L-rhamnosyltransferase
MQSIPVIIVSYRNPGDVIGCLHALRRLETEPEFAIFICENGGQAAYAVLRQALVSRLCDPCLEPFVKFDPVPQFARVHHLKYRDSPTRVTIAEARENFGYAGAINPWLAALLPIGDWPGVWILNPDTEPEPVALAELVACSSARGLGMVGSRVVKSPQDPIVLTRGLHWSSLKATTIAIDRDISAEILPDLDKLESYLDAASGVSIYITRKCLMDIGMMDEKYFLYFEDLEWGLRAKAKAWRIGYCHNSIVVHKGGTTIGSARTRGGASKLSVYLDFRNRTIFVWDHHRLWFLWTIIVLLLRTVEFGLAGSFSNMRAAVEGLKAGLWGEIGRPDGQQ